MGRGTFKVMAREVPKRALPFWSKLPVMFSNEPSMLKLPLKAPEPVRLMLNNPSVLLPGVVPSFNPGGPPKGTRSGRLVEA